MLTFLGVKNYALIDEVAIELDRGFNVMTGETGAGKSILVDALGLALGDRADASAVRHGTSKAEISVIFECPSGHPAVDWLVEHGLEDGESCSLRRVISSEGRSRAFVNNQPVTLQDLRTLGGLLIDIHGQQAHQSIVRPAEQRRLLDSFGGHEALAAGTAAAFAGWLSLRDELEERRKSGADREAQIGTLEFQIRELEALGIEEGEVERIESEHERLAHADELARAVQSALDTLYETESQPAYSLVVQAFQALSRISRHDPALRETAERLGALEIEIRDLASSLAHYRDGLEPDPARLEQLESRLARVGALAHRHRVEERELHTVLGELNAALEALTGTEASLEALEARVAEARGAYLGLARDLSAARKTAAERLSALVSEQLGQLGLGGGEFLARVEPRAEEQADGAGIDAIEFRVRLNAGHPFGPMSRVASGGELSRISLAIEVVAAGGSSIPTLVFDEVDVGIGGGVAEIVGKRLASVAGSRQVLCVTHLPQVASQGAHHYRVVKLSDRSTSRTSVRRLEADERVEELSRMLGGVEITDATRAHARDMISRAAR